MPYRDSAIPPELVIIAQNTESSEEFIISPYRGEEITVEEYLFYTICTYCIDCDGFGFISGEVCGSCDAADGLKRIREYLDANEFNEFLSKKCPGWKAHSHWNCYGT